MTDLLVARLREAIDETQRNAHRFHEQDCDALMGVGGGHGVCDCGEPDRRLRRCAADRKILDAVERYRDPHPGQPCTNADNPWTDCELHSAAEGGISPEVLPILAEAYGVEP